MSQPKDQTKKFLPAEIIQKKKRGELLSAEEISWLVTSFTSGELPDYQMAAWAMAVYFQGLSDFELAHLTLAMRDSGRKFNFQKLNAPRVDKHSTGGVGDKTSLIIGPIWAAAEIYNPMIAGRGLGHTGGTLDKLESIPGFRIHLSAEELERNVEKYFFSIMGQTKDICPADRKLYALRDVTATVDSIPLICASIMSKKLAEDLTGLVLDVKFGNGAFMKTLDDAEKLARTLVSTGVHNGVKVHAVLTDMNQPLGRFAGNSLEVFECIEILQGKKCMQGSVDFYESTRELSLQLASHGFVFADKAATLEEGYKKAKEILDSGAAFTAFKKLCEYQGPARLDQLPLAKFKADIVAKGSGYISKINTEKLGLALIEIGAGRRKSDDQIDHSAGFEFLCRHGDHIEKNQALVKVHCADQQQVQKITDSVLSSFEFSNAAPQGLPLIARVIP
ncbi:MAG: thymidine phosphorylase [Bdellovibrionota bacterium]